MEEAKIDRSLAEVRQWRKEVQEELGELSPEAEAEELNRRAEAIIREYGLIVKSRPVPKVA